MSATVRTFRFEQFDDEMVKAALCMMSCGHLVAMYDCKTFWLLVVTERRFC